jgi:hypothetical protein
MLGNVQHLLDSENDIEGNSISTGQRTAALCDFLPPLYMASNVAAWEATMANAFSPFPSSNPDRLA